MKIRNKLMATTVMLVVSALMMTIVSYAWFSISQEPTTNFSATTVVNENLEIALYNDTTVPADSGEADTGNFFTWGNTVSVTTSLGVLRPVELDSNTLKYPLYAADGRIASLQALTPVQGTAADAQTQYVIKDTDAAAEGDQNGTEAWAYAVDMMIRTNVAGTISLKTGTVTLTGGTQTLQDAIRVAVDFGTAQDIAAAGAFTYDQFNADITSITATTDNENTLSGGDTFEVTAADVNKEIPVRVVIFLDGNAVLNQDVAESLTAEISLTFQNDGITEDPMSKN